MLGRVISFGDTAYTINTIALKCTDVFGTTNIDMHDHPRRTLMQKFI
jgi:hypothetical protein